MTAGDQTEDPQLEALLDYVLRTRNSDFTGYKRASLTRRITKRMQALGLESYTEYTDRLEVDPDEFQRFFDCVLINATSFFRDDEAWAALRELIATKFGQSADRESPIRVWSAGTSTGQEAYSLAILKKADGANPRERTFLGRPRSDDQQLREQAPGRELTELSFDTAPIPTLVVDAAGRVDLINGMARRVFRLSELDLTRPFQDLDVSFRPVELRSSIETAYREQRPVVHRDVEYPIAPAQSRFLDVEVMPLFDGDDAPVGVSITFADVTRHRELQEELAHAKHQLEDAYEELQSTNEELETTGEELQSTVEELQSTNEELETMNEELQSTNDELQVANEELRIRGDQLNGVNAFLESILSGLRRGVMVVDRKLVVQVWNDLSEELWGLRQEEVVGHHVTNLDIGLPVAELRVPLQRIVSGASPAEEITLDAHNRRGHPITCTTVISPRLGVGGDVAGALLITQESPAPG